jgi:hypothetical protein
MRSLLILLALAAIFFTTTSSALARGSRSGGCSGGCCQQSQKEMPNSTIETKVAGWLWNPKPVPPPAPAPVVVVPVAPVVTPDACTPANNAGAEDAAVGRRHRLLHGGKAVIVKAANVATLPVRVLRR